MIPPAFEYLNPNQLSEAISLLQKHGEDAKILAGGHSLIPAMKLRFASPKYLIDIGGIEGMDYLREEGGQLKIGAMTRESSLEEAELIYSILDGNSYWLGGFHNLSSPEYRTFRRLGMDFRRTI